MSKENILIAEFMGAKVKGTMYYFPEPMPFTMAEESRLSFHNSWDWLMPVVGKTYQLGLDNEDVLVVRDAVAEANLNDTYNAVVDCIKKENATKKEPVETMLNKKITHDDTRDVSIRILEEFIANGYIENSVDEDDNEEYFEMQDIAHNHINKLLDIDEEDNFEVNLKSGKKDQDKNTLNIIDKRHFAEITKEVFHSIIRNVVQAHSHRVELESASKDFYHAKGVDLILVHNHVSNVSQYYLADINS
jgi:hypothetical protein